MVKKQINRINLKVTEVNRQMRLKLILIIIIIITEMYADGIVNVIALRILVLPMRYNTSSKYVCFYIYPKIIMSVDGRMCFFMYIS